MNRKHKYVAYYRVSTQRQGQSGLGLEAQRNAVRSFIARPEDLLEEFTEVESGKKNHRPELAAAIRYANDHGATLIIAKLDRLSRNAGFIFMLRDSKVDFVCADMPDANTLTIGIFAVMAQHERETISARTKAALAVKKAQGFKLGSPQNLNDHARQRSLDVRRQKHADYEQTTEAITKELAAKWRKDHLTLQAIADKLNARKLTTRTGKNFTRREVCRLLETESLHESGCHEFID